MLEQVGDIIKFDSITRYGEYGTIKAIYELKSPNTKEDEWEKRKILYKVEIIGHNSRGMENVDVNPNQVIEAYRKYYDVKELSSMEEKK